MRTICGFRTVAQHPKINYLDIGDRAAMKRIPTPAILERELAQAADPGREGVVLEEVELHESGHCSRRSIP